MYPEIFYSNTFFISGGKRWKTFYWNIAGSLVHGQVLLVIWFVVAVLLLLSALGTSNADRIHMGFKTLWKRQLTLLLILLKN
jgi:F-type H+-transporting ATPase subunit a